MKIYLQDDAVFLSQQNHINSGLEELGVSEAKPSLTPLSPGLKLKPASDAEHEQFKGLNINYCSAIGMLNHIGWYTWPKVSFAVSSLSRFSAKPSIIHWKKLKWAWRYLNCTRDHRLKLYFNPTRAALKVFTNALWADNPKTWKLQSGYLCLVYGSVISWNSSKQRNISWSSTDAELMALVSGFHEANWIKAIIKETLGIDIKCIPLSIDNSRMEDKIWKFGSNSKTCHIDLKTKGMRDELNQGNISINLVSSHNMPADAPTKACAIQSLDHLVKCYTQIE